jgi:hypothetical protein
MKICKCEACQMLVTLAIVREMLGDQNGADYLMSRVTLIDTSEGYSETWTAPTVDSVEMN